MKHSFVFATADSRLHADIMMIRLRRAGLNIDRVSAIFSHQFAPNSFFFWLKSPRTLRCRTKGESFFVAGPLQHSFGGGDEVEAVPSVLRKMGVDRSEAGRLARALWLGHGVLCVHAKNQDEAAVAWHIFKHSRAAEIVVSGVNHTERPQHREAPLAAAWAPAFA